MTRYVSFFISLIAAGLAAGMPEGFEIQEFAGPPEVDYPTAVMASANGDVYVPCDRNGSLGKKEGMGRVMRCRDTDGDGKADQFVAFVPEINSPRGGHFVADTLYIIHPPFLSSYRDTDGDGVADEHKVLVKGLGGGIEHPRGADHTTNGVRVGIDGWLYISVGDFGTFPAVGTDGSSVTLHGGGVLRVRPDGSKLEAHSLMVRNICDTAISPELDLFSRDNTNDGKGWNTRFHHHTALADHGYPRLYQNFADEEVKPLADYGGGSGTGALWLSEPGFPAEFSDMLFSTDWTTGTVHHHPWKKDGASFSVEQKTFMKLPRAIDIDVDGSSRLYVADWRNGRFNFAGPDTKVGMIQQITWPQGKAAVYQDVTKAGDAELVKRLASASAVQRLEVQREILKRDKKPLFSKMLAAMVRDKSQSVAVRTAAVFTLRQLDAPGCVDFLVKEASDPLIREAALRAIADHVAGDAGMPVKLFTEALTDNNPRVVLQALIGLKRMGAKESAKAILDASVAWEDGEVSPRLNHTAMQVLASLGNAEPLLAAVANADTRQLALLSLMRMHRKDVVDGLIARFEKTGDMDERFDILAALARLSHREKEWDRKSWWGTRPDDRGPYFQPVEWEASAVIRSAIEKGYGMIADNRRGEMINVLSRNRLPVAQLKLAGADPVLVALNLTHPDNATLRLLADAAMDSKRPFDERVKIYQALSRGDAKVTLPLHIEVLAAWSDEPDKAATHIGDFINSPERAKQIAMLRQIASKGNDSASTIAWKAMLTVLHSPLSQEKAKQQVRDELVKNPMETGLFRALAAMRLSGFDAQIEAAMKSDNRELVEAAKAVRRIDHDATAASTANMTPEQLMKHAMTHKGDIAVGAKLYTSRGCIACHSIDPDAEQKGPYLGAAGAKFTRDYLIESIIDPNKVVAQGFQTKLLQLKDGSSKLGFVTGEEDGVVELRDIAGQVSHVRREDIANETELPNSMMPPGLANGLSAEEFTALIEYLVSLRATGG
jgi:putative heme-binding domain-containing protein